MANLQVQELSPDWGQKGGHQSRQMAVRRLELGFRYLCGNALPRGGTNEGCVFGMLVYGMRFKTIKADRRDSELMPKKTYIEGLVCRH